MGFCEEFTVWQFTTVLSCDISEVLNVETLLQVERSQPLWFVHVTRMSQEWSARHMQRATPKRKRPRVDQGADDAIASLTLSVPSLCGPRRNVWNCWKPLGTSSLDTVDATATPQRKASMKINEWKVEFSINGAAIINTVKYEVPLKCERHLFIFHTELCRKGYDECA